MRQGERHKDQLPRILRRTMKDCGERTEAQLVGKHAEQIEGSRERLGELRRRQRTQCELKIDFDDAQLHEGKLLVRADGLNFEYAPGRPLWREPLSLEIRSGERIRLTGDNGTGKTTLVRLLTGELDPTAGRIGRADFSYGCLDQQYSRVNTPQSVLELAQSCNRGNLQDHELKLRLHRALFAQQMWDKRCDTLSGGERMRLCLCCLMIANHVPDLFVLDEPTNNLDIDTIRWLEQTLNDRDSTMIIISHDRHFLNMVCTHMADLDYGELRVYPGNYDEYMTAATQARERLLADNAKKKAQIADLQSFVSRFSANASKSRQATSRARQIDKIKLEEVKASSRQNPFIRFEQDKKLFRNALEVEALTKGFDEGPLFKNVNLLLEVGEKIAILGANGVGKSTMLKTLVGELQPDNGSVKWSENAQIGYYAQDHEYEFENDLTVFEWMSQWKQEGDDEQAVRSILGRLLFSQDDIKKPAKVLSGGEKGRMLFGKLMMQKPNILVMDEPTNHLDMESIESLNMALEMYQGTLIFVSHDREFVSSLATRVLEITPDRVIDFSGNYEDYLRSKGIE